MASSWHRVAVYTMTIPTIARATEAPIKTRSTRGPRTVVTVRRGDVITRGAPEDRITGVPLSLSSAAAVGVTTTNPSETGWLYQFLIKVGVDPGTAHTVSDLLLRPLEILIVVVLAVIVASLGRRAIRGWVGRAATHAAAMSGKARAKARTESLIGLLGNVWRVFVVVVAVLIVLGIVGIDLTPILASATVIGATIGFGAQSLVRDYLSGFLLTVEDQFSVGETISVAETTGTVEDVTLRVTKVRLLDGSVCFIPNGDIRTLANANRGWAKAVVDVPASRGSADHLNRLRHAVGDAALAVAGDPQFADSCSEPPEVLGLVDSDADTCTIRVALKTTSAQRAPLERALREAVVGAVSVTE